jgi:hypothetical protein
LNSSLQVRVQPEICEFEADDDWVKAQAEKISIAARVRTRPLEVTKFLRASV